ncbi:MAG: hypothetical protein JSR86_13435, partial [Proteobacteria bacterium]|nr:hypothetical protein [Pseudomonadota bacterium]
MAQGPAVIAALAVLLAGEGAAAPVARLDRQLPAQPPLAPGDEAVRAPARTPWPACVARAAGEAERAGGRLERALVTGSAQWGLIWRADVALPDARPGQVARAVCWSDQLQFVRGRALPALPFAPAGSKRPAAVRCNYTPIDNPCRQEPVRILWLCVSPQLFLYADGHAEPA